MSENLEQLVIGNFVLLVYFVTLAIAIYNYRKYFDTYLKYFPIIIAYTFFNEVLGLVIRYSDKFAFFDGQTFANDLIYNIYDLFYYGFFYWVYWKLAQSPISKKIVKYFSLTVLATYIISCFFQNPVTISLYYATALGSFVLAGLSFNYLLSLRKRNWTIERYNLMVWIAMGLIVFHTIFPGLFLTAYLKAKVWYQYHFQTILRFLIVIMYTLFCIGFIISRRRAFR